MDEPDTTVQSDATEPTVDNHPPTPKIYPYLFYYTILRETDPANTSPFMGISPSMLAAGWTMPFICSLPISILEPLWDCETKVARRIAGASYRYAGLRLSDLPGLEISWSRPFCIILTTEETTARAVEEWRRNQPLQPLHISSEAIGSAISPDSVNQQNLADYCSATLSLVADLAVDAEHDLARWRSVISRWTVEPATVLPNSRLDHNCTAINNAVLESAGYSFPATEQFTAHKTSDFVAAIKQSYSDIDEIRANIPLLDLFKQLPPVPELFVFAPAMYRSWYEPDAIGNADKGLGKGGRRLIRALQTQVGYTVEMDGELAQSVLSSPTFRELLSIRTEELTTQSSAVAIRASSHFATTIRVPLGVNKSYGRLRQLAFNARGSDVERRKKFAKLFRETQAEIASYIPPEFLDRIDRAAFGIKLICDAPLEWIPSGDLPLFLRHNVTRLPATPGNLSIMSLTGYPGIGLHPNAFREILHIEATLPGDPAHGAVRSAISSFQPILNGKVSVRHVSVSGINEFVEAVNQYDGPLMIFDGHGSHSDRTDVGNIHIGNESCDVWALRGRLRTPPIVLLSACDTHALDRSHVTAANGFLALGAQSVIGTLLPIGILSGAIFVARFLYRLADFIPAALREYDRSLRWPEIVTGMLRMTLATDILRGLEAEGRLTEVQATHLHTRSNLFINSPAPHWYELLIQEIADHAGHDLGRVTSWARHQVGLSDAIRYVHLGNGEHITVGQFGAGTDL